MCTADSYSQTFTAIDHVQLAMPGGQEQAARNFYAGVLGMREPPKPAELAARGGCWFEIGGVQIHLGVEPDFHPAKRAHPAFRCAEYDTLLDKFRSAGITVHEPNDIPACAAATFTTASATA
jgi:catechol 2,3-dioxygenase-like lactoylglutathione lyase family enzyme